MSKSVRPVQRDRMSQARLDKLIINPPPAPARRVLTSSEEFDTFHPEETIKGFCSQIREMLSRYESDMQHLNLLDSKMQDLLHYIEMSKDKNANVGYKLYKQLCAVRRERRVCKNEIALLQPVYETFNGSGIMNSLAHLQGVCRQVKQTIDNKVYTVRTDVLEEYPE